MHTLTHTVSAVDHNYDYLGARARTQTHTCTHTLLKRAQCKLKAIVIPYGSCGSASQEACEKSRGACWAVGMWSLSCWPQSARQLWRSQLLALHSCCFSRWLYTRSHLWTVSNRGYWKWVRGESWVGFAWAAWTEFLKWWSINSAATKKNKRRRVALDADPAPCVDLM